MDFFPFMFTEHEWKLIAVLEMLEGGGGGVNDIFSSKRRVAAVRREGVQTRTDECHSPLGLTNPYLLA